MYNPFILILLLLSIIGCKQNKEKYKIQLGKKLFQEKKLSKYNTKSCSSCHSTEYAFTDGYRRSVSSIGEELLHNAPTLLNIQNYKVFDWDKPTNTTLQNQIKRPLYNMHPLEMGYDSTSIILKQYFASDSSYQTLFNKAYGKNCKYDATEIEDAIITYINTLQARNSKYDQYVKGNPNAMNKNELKGMNLFFSPKLKCAQCHLPPDFTLVTHTNNIDSLYINIGLYNILPFETYPIHDIGLHRISQKENDNGKFRIPGLRNVALTAPYMHDGSVANLNELIDIYAQGGRVIKSGLYMGDGTKNKHKDKRISGFAISQEEKENLILFLHCLTDTNIYVP